MEWETLHRGEDTYFHGSAIRGGQIFAQNCGLCVEERYPTAYNLGSGKTKWPHWISVDGNGLGDIKADLRDLSVIASDSADAIAAIHVVEHFYEWEVEPMLREWRRILKPGGKLIIELPCMNKVMQYMTWTVANQKDMLPFMSIHALYGDGKHHDPAMAHRFGWFITPMGNLLKKIFGEGNVQHCSPRYHFAFRDMRWECLK